MVGPPSPHPLDFDWRYDQKTTSRLAEIIRDAGPILLLGAPSVARLLEREEVDVTLVDRQPFQGVRGHIVCPVEEFTAVSGFRTALIDPPWYPKQLRDWSHVAGRAVGIGGSVFASVWPDHTRPHGTNELLSTLSEISSWAEIKRNVESLSYVEPAFEAVARHQDMGTEFSKSPLVGELVRLVVRRLPERLTGYRSTERWLRFIVDDYQLALRLDIATSFLSIRAVPNAKGWQWPYVSMRAPLRDQIGLWSSCGEVASVGDPATLAKMLRCAFSCSDSLGFEAALATAPELLSWCIPRPPYWRLIEWQHRQ